MLFCRAEIFLGLKSLWEVQSAFVLHSDPDSSRSTQPRSHSPLFDSLTMLFSRRPISMTMSRCGQTGVDCASRGGDRGGGTGALLGAALSPASPHSLDHHTLTLGLSCHPTIPAYHTQSTTMHFMSAYHATMMRTRILPDILCSTKLRQLSDCPKFAQIAFTKILTYPT